LSAPARAALDDFIGTVSPGEKLKWSYSMARSVADMWVRKGGMLSRRRETNLVWVDLNHAGSNTDEFIQLGTRFGVKLDGPRIVLHYQIGEEALKRLEWVSDTILSGKAE
jgi:threonine aldolase